MFETSILADPPKAQKRSTLLVSFLAQIAICGVLLLIPLVYTDAITFAPQWSAPILPPRPPQPPKFEVVQETRPTRSAGRTFIPSQPVFTAPTTIPREIPVIVDSLPPSDYVPDSIPTGLPTSAGLPGIRSIPGPPEPTPPPAAKPVQPPKPGPAPQAAPVRISPGAQAAKLMTKVVPVYPTIARQIRLQGTVRMHAIIGRDGKIRDLQVTDGPPLLRQAATDAVRQWVYRPTMLGTEPVEVDTTIEVTFVLH